MNLETLKTTVTQTRMDRRSLLKRVGILGASLPVAGILLSACGGDDDTQASANTGNSDAQPSGDTVELTIKAFDLGFDPESLEVAAGQKVRLTFINDGAMEHDWEVTGLTTDDFAVVSQPNSLSSRVSDLLKEKLADGTPYAGAPTRSSTTAWAAPSRAAWRPSKSRAKRTPGFSRSSRPPANTHEYQPESSFLLEGPALRGAFALPGGVMW